MPLRGRRLIPRSPRVVEEPAGARGVLRISELGSRPAAPGSGAPAPLAHRTVYVRGLHGYEAMEDNDLRGYLDGGFRWGWNQPRQVHVRLGRDPTSGRWPRFGEHELFRTLHRWDAISLPPSATLRSARLEVAVERGCARPLRVLLYSVHKDWNPGAGGTELDSSSPPRRGEVWWNEARHGERPWGLPGAGFASDEHPDADTPAMPLAEAAYRPGAPRLAFAGRELTRYAAERLAARRPLLFLLKLSDHLEDIPGALLVLHSANGGDSANPATRPRLVLEWRPAAEAARLERRLRLEHGRSTTLRVRREAAGSFAVSYLPDRGSDLPSLHWRGLEPGGWSPWRPLRFPVRLEGEALEVRIAALRHPVELGATFAATLADTWVLGGAPETKRVRWVFRSPSGRRHECAARYVGRFTWRVEFEPDEVGRWSYRWRHALAGREAQGPEGCFDVVLGRRGAAAAELERLASSLERGRPRRRELDALRLRFYRLQRALLGLETPDTLRSERGRELRHLVRRVRSGLWGEEVPDPVPMSAHPRNPPANGRASVRALRRGLRGGLRRTASLAGQWLLGRR